MYLLQKISRDYCGIGSGNPASCAYVGGVDVTLNNVENRDVACRLARHRGNHPVFGLQKTTHHIQHGRTPDRLGLVE